MTTKTNTNGTTTPSSSVQRRSLDDYADRLEIGTTFKMFQNARAQIASSGNMFGLKERVVALESLACVASIYEELKPTFERWVGEDLVDYCREVLYESCARRGRFARTCFKQSCGVVA